MVLELVAWGYDSLTAIDPLFPRVRVDTLDKVLVRQAWSSHCNLDLRYSRIGRRQCCLVLVDLLYQGHRAVLVRKNADKLSNAFLLSKHGPHTGIQSIFFSEQMFALLAVPSVL